MLIIDKYAYTNRLKDFNPMAKFYFAIGLLLISLIMKNSFIHLTVILTMISITVLIAKIPFKNYMKILFIPSSFLLLSILAILISITQSEVEHILGLKILGLNFMITTQSINASILLLSRAFASLTCTFFLVLSTPMNDLIYIFKKHRLPKLFIEMTILIYRFIFVFLEEYKEIYVAQQMRFGYINLKTSYKSISYLIVALFIRVMLRFKEMEITLETKCFEKEFHM